MATKKNSDVVKEFVKKTSDDDLKYMNTRLIQRLGGDLAEAIELIQNDKVMDTWLASASSGEDFYNMIDTLHLAIQTEIKKRH